MENGMKSATPEEVAPPQPGTEQTAAPISHDNLRVSAKLVALVTPFMAKADIRYYLNGINIRPHATGGAVICATNGHMLAAVHDPDGVCEHEVTLNISSGTVTALKARGNGGRELALRYGRVAVMEGTDEVALQPGDPVVDGKFPQYQNLIPPADRLKPGLVGQFNTAYIAVLDAAAKIATPKVGPLRAVRFFTLDGQPKSSAVARLIGEPSFVAVLMPQAPDELAPVPAWCAAVPPKDDLAAAAGAA
jgi:hypothetical protein